MLVNNYFAAVWSHCLPYLSLGPRLVRLQQTPSLLEGCDKKQLAFPREPLEALRLASGLSKDFTQALVSAHYRQTLSARVRLHEHALCKSAARGFRRHASGLWLTERTREAIALIVTFEILPTDHDVVWGRDPYNDTPVDSLGRIQAGMGDQIAFAARPAQLSICRPVVHSATRHDDGLPRGVCAGVCSEEIIVLKQGPHQCWVPSWSGSAQGGASETWQRNDGLSVEDARYQIRQEQRQESAHCWETRPTLGRFHKPRKKHSQSKG